MMKKISNLIVAFAVSATVLISGCTTYDAYTGDEKVSNTAKGAGIGAGVGAIAGGGVGYYMDAQEAKLRKQLRETGVSVVREGDKISLVMPGNITFDTGVGSLKSSFYDVLNSVAIVLEEYEKTIIAVSGHTDSTGASDFNQQLSEERARSVANYLKSRNIVDARFEVVGFGENYPIADNSTAEGRAQNRRVELTLIPITES